MSLPPAAATESKAGDRGLEHSTIRSIVVGIMLAMFLSALEQTIVGPALPTIGRVLGDIENLSWVVTAYLLSATAVTPLFGKLSDIYGRRTVMLVCVGIFVVGSAACALAPNMWTLILGRALQGVGGGGILPIAQTIIADMMSPRERPRWQGYFATMFMAASTIGPVLGGFLTDQVHWSLIFWINVPLGVIALLMSDSALRRLPRYDRPHRLDLIGAVLMVGATITLLLALGWGGTRYRWLSPQILGIIAASLALWALFTGRLLTAREPFIPLSMLREPVVGIITFVGFFSIGTVVGLSLVLPLYLELVLSLSASGSGTVMIAFMAGTTLGSIAAGRFLARLDRYRRIAIVGLMIGLVPLVVLAWKPAGLSLAAVAALLLVGGSGLGVMYPFTTVVIQNVVPPHQMGTATGTLNFFRLLGSAIIVAVFGAIVLGSVGLEGGLAAAGAKRMGADFATAFQYVFLTAAFFIVLSLIAVILIEERPLRGVIAAAPNPAAPVAAQ
jgi:EmrB/QacA subfamily drug resistance transporter